VTGRQNDRQDSVRTHVK